jgi:hypothetical protein
MKKFIIKTAIFMLPIVGLFLLPGLLLFSVGENFINIDNQIFNQDQHLVGYAYNESNYKYIKWQKLNKIEKQDIIGLGSSRILQIRDKVFTTNFYNAGFTISRISDFLPFLKSIDPKKYPGTILIALDQWMFNDSWDTSAPAKSPEYWQQSLKILPTSGTIFQVWSDMLTGKYSVLDFFNKSKPANLYGVKMIGLNAHITNSGFRDDGSYYYGGKIDDLLSSGDTNSAFNDIQLRIENGNRKFQYGETISPKALMDLNAFLDFCATQKIDVIAILPPFASGINAKLVASQEHTYMQKIYPEISQIFVKYNQELWDMSRLGSFGSSDAEMIDGMHGGEMVYLKILIHLVNNESSLINHVKLEDLEYSLLHPKNNYLVYEY